MMLRWGGIFRVVSYMGGRNCCRRLASLRDELALPGHSGRILFGEAVRSESGRWFSFQIAYPHPRGGFACRFERVGDDDRDDLSGVGNFGPEGLDRSRRGQAELCRLKLTGIVVGKNVEHARHRTRIVDIQSLNTALSDGARHQDGVCRIGNWGIGRIARSARYLEPPIDA